MTVELKTLDEIIESLSPERKAKLKKRIAELMDELRCPMCGYRRGYPPES